MVSVTACRQCLVRCDGANFRALGPDLRTFALSPRRTGCFPCAASLLGCPCCSVESRPRERATVTRHESRALGLQFLRRVEEAARIARDARWQRLEGVDEVCLEQ